MTSWRRHSLLVLIVLFATVPAFASHSWGKYHWARTSNPFTLKVGNNLSSGWGSYYGTALNDWNNALSVLTLNSVAGGAGSNCSPTSGRIEVCNAAYGDNGWLGIAQIWTSRGTHIAQALAKMNDTYFNQSQYNTPAWRQMVMCQEIAHDWGLGHQDETFNNANLGSCMDYTNDPDGGAGGASSTDPSNIAPNQHDVDQTNKIYAHTDSFNSISFQQELDEMTSILSVPVVVPGDELNEPWRWGTPVSWNSAGQPDVFILHTGHGPSDDEEEGDAIVTHVFWAPNLETAHGAKRAERSK